MNNATICLVFEALRLTPWRVREATQTPYYGEEQFPKEKELIKAQLVVELLDRYHYTPKSIQVNYLVALENGLGNLEADVFVMDENKKPFMVFLVEVPQSYAENYEEAFRILYTLAPWLNKDKTLSYLCYYTRWYEEGNLRHRVTVVEYKKYPYLELWARQGKPTQTSIPSFRGTP